MCHSTSPHIRRYVDKSNVDRVDLNVPFDRIDRHSVDAALHPLAERAYIFIRLLLQLMKATVLAESSILYFIFSLGSLHYSDVFPSFYHFLSFHLSRCSFYINTFYKKINAFN